MKREVRHIMPWETYDWLLKIHYAKRIPNICHAYGLYETHPNDDSMWELNGIVTYGVPASDALCRGICGDEYKHEVLELNRLVISDGVRNKKNSASFLVANSLKMLATNPRIVVSYADTSMGHIGYVYQATNWIYTGLSAKRSEWREIGSNRHSKSVTEKYNSVDEYRDRDDMEFVERSRKHRYIFFVGDKRETKKRRKALKYRQEQYPKGCTERYLIDYKPTKQGVLF